MDGHELYALVERYHGLGVHRAGTDIDVATSDWYESELEHRDLVVERDLVAFDRYDWSSTLTADGQPIDHVPFFYEWTGEIDTTDVRLVTADAHAGGRDGDLDDALDADRAVVIATEHPDGSLVAVNREPHDHGGGPTVLVAGRDGDRLDRADQVRLTMRAALEPATTTNLVARTRHRRGAPLLITTPLTGWFGCAGERGTGAAVLLDLVERFADRHLLVIATGGHELDYLGVRSWVPRCDEPIRAIVHVGASVAVDQPTESGERELIASRLAMTDLAGPAADRIGAALEPASFIFRPDTDGWLGESEVFCALGVPMLSFTGSGVDFHTPDDTPERATSPDALATVAAAIAHAVDELWRSTA
jgi:hypothetical protein